MSLTPKLIEKAHRYGEAKMEFLLALDEHRAANALDGQQQQQQQQVHLPKDAAPNAPEKPKFCECGVAFRKGDPCPYVSSNVRDKRTKITPEGGGQAKLRTLTEQCHKEWEKHHKPKVANNNATGGVKKKKQQKTLEFNKSAATAAPPVEEEDDVDEVVEQYEEEEEEAPLIKRPKNLVADDEEEEEELCMEPE